MLIDPYLRLGRNPLVGRASVVTARRQPSNLLS
jgi:hypothetical protein